MEMLLLKLFLIFSITMLSVGGAKWNTRYNIYSIGMLQDAVMDCDIGDANFTGFYRQNGNKIEETDRIKINKDESIVTLDISRITEADYDTYICKDSNNGSDHATLEILASLEQNPQSPQILLVGDPGIVQLRVYGNPKPRMTWYITRPNKNIEKIASVDASGNMKTNVDGMYRIDTEGSLHVSKIRAEDAGVYSLVVNTIGARFKGAVTVKVEFKLELKTKPQASFVRAVGQRLFIPCEWLYADTEFPKWTFTSKKGITTVIKDGISKKGLEIAAVSMDSEGKYTCAASNKYGNLSVETSLSQVIDPAKIITDFNDIIKRKLKTPYQLICEATGKPNPNVKLSKLKADRTGFEFITGGLGKVTKMFPTLGITDGGLYSCHADNGAKTLDGASMDETKNITLEVFAPTEIDKKATTSNIVSAIGLDFIIKCTARGYPYPKMELLGDGKNISTEVTTVNDVVTAKLLVTSAKQSNFAYKEISCTASNAYGNDNKTIPITQILKARNPEKLRIVGTIGLSEIDLQWDAVPGADDYIIFYNDTNDTTREVKVQAPQVTINNLKRKTFYSIKVASVNLAGVGNHSDPVIFETADIIRPKAVTEFRVEALTSRSAMIIWKAPSNVDEDLITYHTKYCSVKNETVVVECSEKEKKESRLKLKDLVESTKYQIQVIAINQGKEGLAGKPFFFTTKVPPPPTEPPTEPVIGILSSGEIAGIIVAIILIILIVVDLFCCFFNNCGFSHCCFETFCAAKDKKFLPVETTEGYEAQELEEKPPNVV